MELYLHKGKPLIKQQLTEKIVGYIPLDYTELSEEPVLSVNIGKIPLELWRTINLFFKKVAYAEKSEAQVRLFYSDELKSWKAWAFPQKAGSGMTTKELNDHPDFQDQMNTMLDGDKYYQFGSIHSHVFSSAFQSGVDKNDESTSPGVHITIGKLDQKKIDIHSRFTVIIPGQIEFLENGETKVTDAKKMYSGVDLMDFIEIPDGFFGEKLPHRMRKLIFSELIEENSDTYADTDIIEKWMQNRISEKVQSVSLVSTDRDHKYNNDSYFYNHYSAPPFSWNTINTKPGKLYKNHNQDSSKKNNKTKKYQKDTTNCLYQTDAVDDLLEPIVDKICVNNKITQSELFYILSKPEQLLTAKDINILCEVDSNIYSPFGLTSPWLIKVMQGWFEQRKIEQLELSVVSSS
jgi:hypothetical protein